MNTKMQSFKSEKGFTLIELLVVIGILAILLSITLIAINPARQFAQANNTKRSSDVNALLNAVGEYAADNKGQLPAAIPNCDPATDSTQCKGPNFYITKATMDICADLVTKYMAALPVDPLTNNGTPITDCTSSYTTGYQMYKDGADNRVVVTAPNAELSQSISVTR